MNTPLRPFPRRCRRRSFFGILAGGFLFCLACPVVSGMDYFLKISDVPGEITDGGFTGWTRLTGLSADVLRALPVPPETVGTAVAGVHFTKVPGGVSSALMSRCASGLVTPRVVLICKDGTTPALRITLNEVLISSFQSAAGGTGGPPEDDIGCTFRSIEWSYAEHEGVSGGTTAVFNVATQTGEIKPRVPFRAALQPPRGQPGDFHLTCPVEAGHRYRVSGNLRLSGPWQPLQEFSALTDGVMEVTIPQTGPVLFLRVEEID